MTTDITELAQSLKAAAENATPGEWCSDDQYGIVADAGLNGNYYIASCSGPEHRSNKRFIALANPANVLALVEALEKAQAQSSKWLEAYHKAVSIGARYEERIAELESFRTAYMEWSDKTDWVNTDRRFGVVKPLGKHMADVLKTYIEHLESRTVKLPKFKMLEDYLAEVAIEERKQILVGVKLEFHRACAAAGIKVEAE